jgi:hypothetical protein
MTQVLRTMLPGPVERAGPMDRAFLAMADGGVPQQLGAVLELDGAVPLAVVRELVGELAAVAGS